MKRWQYGIIWTFEVVIIIALSIVISVVVPDREEKVCNEISFEVTDYDKYQFITTERIEQHLKSTGTNPIGEKTSDIDLSEIERAVSSLNLVKEAVCYFDTEGRLNIKASQRVPLFRVKSANGDYYVDSDRQLMPTSIRYTAHVPVVTGNVDQTFATTELYDFIRFIVNDSRWKSAFTQIYVYPDNEVELIPRVGNFIIDMGRLDRYEAKLNKLDIFLDKVPRYKSWNEYSEIDLKYRDQVVCKRR